MKTVVAVLLFCCVVIPASAAKKYSYFRVGNPNDVTTATTPGTVLMGGAQTLTRPSNACANAAAMATFW